MVIDILKTLLDELGYELLDFENPTKQKIIRNLAGNFGIDDDELSCKSALVLDLLGYTKEELEKPSNSLSDLYYTQIHYLRSPNITMASKKFKTLNFICSEFNIDTLGFGIWGGSSGIIRLLNVLTEFNWKPCEFIPKKKLMIFKKENRID